MALLGVAEARAGEVIGGWDASRGGDYSLSAGATAAQLRSLIATDFPGATITGTPTLTSSYLSTVNVLVIAAAFTGNNVAITPLSSAEQAALDNFVLGGGTAILISDNNFAYQAASNSFNSVFGVNVTGDLTGNQNGTVTNTTNPVTNGPFGLATGFAGNFPGYFDSLGSSAVSLGTWQVNGIPGVAEIAPGVLGPHSGAVVFFSDSFPIDELGLNAGNPILIANALALGISAVPEPSAAILMAVGGLTTLALTSLRTGLPRRRSRPRG